MRIPELPPSAALALKGAGSYLSGLLTPTVRLGVTGLSRAGKTVFITALVRNLTTGGRLPFFSANAEGRIVRAYLEPQPDDLLPRFDYERHIRALDRDPPEWPESTSRISELRVTIEYRSERALKRLAGLERLHLDIVDYPGEWLLDLALMSDTFAGWSERAAARAREKRHAEVARPWLRFLDHGFADGDDPEQTAIAGARLYTDYLGDARALNHALSTEGPGRFLMPGDLAGSPVLTFFPLEAERAAAHPALAQLLDKRFEAYKREVATPFFRNHFARLDRQIVLVDALSALNGGPEPLGELERALDSVLRVFKSGAPTWLAALTGRRIDRVLFAATKADHLHSSNHDRLEAILRAATDRAMSRAEGAGALVGVVAMAALRATREVEAKDGEVRLPCIAGVPLPGEQVGGRKFDGKREAVVFPGDLPDDATALFEHGQPASAPLVNFVRFRPPRVAAPDAGGASTPAPHIRLDRALEFLIGDWLE